MIFEISGFSNQLPFANQIFAIGQKRAQNYLKNCILPSTIVYCYQYPFLLQKLGKMLSRKEPQKFATILIKW